MSKKTRTPITTQRAIKYCETLKQYENDRTRVIVDWKKSRMYGYNPRIDDMYGQKMTNINGCGYCKLSTALAQVFQYLGNTEDEQDQIARLAGSGEGPVIDGLAAIGWKLEKYFGNNVTDVYTLSKITKDQ